ncbi:2-oxoglutarate dehydrogenase, E2 component, dihydrolipoamide succinyltransferase [Roseisolibacter sp. H3M3-2]|uniref:2-oxoglutarate dehydrogenase, E2 component, dihydrolipoamide succinyltransferase n=1 Tax=Roseisolibacter sp. H3M3-2 TaxID=3031323 RepID=UPI0023DC29B6|nr:2-oxoglutarate dehydrogenase, E2 component, dihydrolipoamide succinyltransferase [Roseisolibacter sp. H3M3-2]MDF1502982.1 2-oxoglutarate dehydrogenase, E2 component, dihydrolipoamide succinyltransferase [Roseisolibacter sp. H3M3-2]
MARVDVIMPQMGESIAEGTLSRWLKKVGDEVKRDEPIFEISTDKVDAEIPAPTAGILAEVSVTEGQTVAVGTIVARIETDKSAPIGAPAAASAPAAATSAPAASSPAAAAPAAAAPAAPAGNGNAFEDRIRTKSSPLVRKIAAEHGIEIAALQGSGIAGRVTKKDLEAFLESGAPAPTTAAPAAPSAPAPARPAVAAQRARLGELHAPAVESMPGDVVEPMSRIRQLTAEHMVLSRRWNAHVTSFFEIDLTRVARIRAKARAEFERTTGEKLTYLPFIIKAVTDGLKAFPVLNAAVRGTDVVYRKQYNIGIAVALDWGLIVPVIKNADDLSLTGLTRNLNDLANRARTKKLQPQEVQGATFTITNPGVFGSLMGTPIIPVPTSGIMGVGAIEKRPKVITGPDGEDTIAIRTCSYFSMSFDHRIVDGSDADRFMAFVKKQLESWPEQGGL